MGTSALKFGFNHMVCPSLSPEDFLKAAVSLGVEAVELRNDIGVNSITDVASARDAGAMATDLGLEIRSINALYPFNIWTDAMARKAEALAKVGKACGAVGLVMCPLNEGKMLDDTPAKAAGLRAALRALHTILGEHGLKGFVEPLGFPISSLRFKRDALSAIDDIGGADTFSVVHDTFHHRGAGETAFFATRTGLVHISGVEDPVVTFDDMRDADRVLVGPNDRLGNIAQLKTLLADGFSGIASFEPFAADVHNHADPIGAVRESMTYIRTQLDL